MHLLQAGVGAAVEALHLLLLQSFQQPESVSVHTTPLSQDQRSCSIVITVNIFFIRLKTFKASIQRWSPTHHVCYNMTGKTQGGQSRLRHVKANKRFFFIEMLLLLHQRVA